MAMARVEWWHDGRCSYKTTTLVVCFVNIVVALYVLHFLYSSLCAYPSSDYHTTFEYTIIQIRKMEESNHIRKASEPTKLIELAAELKKRNRNEDRAVELPQHLKQKLMYEILDRLRRSEAAANATALQEAIESWRKRKLKEAKRLMRRKVINSTILPEEAGAVETALSAHWAALSEEIGLWMPVEIIHKEHEKSDDEADYDDEILPGKKPPPECHVELHTDYDGSAVRWGLTHHQESAYDCCMACLDQANT